MNRYVASLGVSVFERMSALAREHDAINLGQGFPDDAGPESVRRAAAEAVVHGNNQYPPSRGTPELRAAVAEHYTRCQGLALDPSTEILITSGATEALAAACLALLEPGDEALLIDPAYDPYAPLVRRAGGVPRRVALAPPAFRLDVVEIERALTPKTRLLLVNQPQNPAAVVHDAHAVAALAALARDRDLWVVSDEVWEHVIFDGTTHRSLLAEPDLRGRCVKIGSAGKMFSLTGWKVGFVCASAELTAQLARAHQFLTFSTPPNLQAAVATGLARPRTEFEARARDFELGRDHLAAGLTRLGWSVTPSAATYFLLARPPAAFGVTDGPRFAEAMIEEVGVAAVPLDAFYELPRREPWLRFCFAKRRATLDAALERLAQIEPRWQRPPHQGGATEEP